LILKVEFDVLADYAVFIYLDYKAERSGNGPFAGNFERIRSGGGFNPDG
jgi:hypothetical protein